MGQNYVDKSQAEAQAIFSAYGKQGKIASFQPQSRVRREDLEERELSYSRIIARFLRGLERC